MTTSDDDAVLANGRRRPHIAAEVFVIALTEGVEKRQPWARLSAVIRRAAEHGRAVAQISDVLGRYAAETDALERAAAAGERDKVRAAVHELALLRVTLQEAARQRGERRRGVKPPPLPKEASPPAPPMPAARPPRGSSQLPAKPAGPGRGQQGGVAFGTGVPDATPAVLRLSPKATAAQENAFRKSLAAMAQVDLARAIQATYARMVELDKVPARAAEAAELRAGVRVALELERSSRGGPAKPASRPPRKPRDDRGR
jgi:hypothetical protein